MTMTDTEAKALALVNEAAQDRLAPVWPSFERSNGTVHEALCLAIEREEATEARHAAELREQAERFSEAIMRHCGGRPLGGPLAPFILPAPDPLVEAAQEAFSAMLRANSPDGLTEALRTAIQARGGKIVWEAGE